MKIVVCVKSVPTQYKINPATGNLDRTVPATINPCDRNALEAALSWKEVVGGEVTVVSMGAPAVQAILRECLAMGADQALLLSDRCFAGADSLATTLTLSEGIRRFVPDFDLILCGQYAEDAETCSVGPGIAARLGLPLITFAERLEYDAGRHAVRAGYREADGHCLAECALPAVVTVADVMNTPRHMHMNRIAGAASAAVTVWGVRDLELEESRVGEAGSPTRVGRIFRRPGGKEAGMFRGGPREQADRLLDILKTAGVTK